MIAMPAMPRYTSYTFSFSSLLLTLLSVQFSVVLSVLHRPTSTLDDLSRRSRTVPDYVVRYGTEKILPPDDEYGLIHHAI